MTIKPFIERNPAIDEYAPRVGVDHRKGFGLFTFSGWCLFGVEYMPAYTLASGTVWPWMLDVIVCNIAFGLWNDPD